MFSSLFGPCQPAGFPLNNSTSSKETIIFDLIILYLVLQGNCLTGGCSVYMFWYRTEEKEIVVEAKQMSIQKTKKQKSWTGGMDRGVDS